MFPQLLTLLPIFVFLRDVQCFVNTKFGLPSLVVPIPCQADVLYEQFNYICVKNQIVCLPGWTNPENYCRDPACPEGCDENHGSCTKPNVCHCRAGYFGHACQNCVPLPGCIQGTCKQAYECNCNEGWQGVFCSEAICKEGCHPNSGFCDLPGQCECHIGWQSENCTDCAVLPGCIHGYCNRPLECICEEGWTGEFCDTPICKEKCHPAYGSCDFPGACICSSGYQGELCDECRPYPGCEHGTCREPWTCNCEPGWEGTQCNIPRQEGRFIPSRNHEDFNYGGSNYQYQRGR
ncbi:delta-like protein 1 [Tigriopus californicus]|uniref:delta-like protein 1 n=1 Tax=Tigriopus californicus TaxID=6832 RepID=UPI0027D9D52A|nr:delta-like protein 1 [Tigriopus californicus]